MCFYTFDDTEHDNRAYFGSYLLRSARNLSIILPSGIFFLIFQQIKGAISLIMMFNLCFLSHLLPKFKKIGINFFFRYKFDSK